MSLHWVRVVRPVVWLVGVLAVVLVATVGGMPTVEAAGVASEPVVPAPEVPGGEDPGGDDAEGEDGEAEGDEVPSRDDSATAMVDAIALGERVEDLSQRTEFTRVYANPDRSWTNETASGPESVQDADGEWQDIDTSLVERDGVLVPRAVPTDLVLSGGGDRVFASMARDGQDFGWRWDAPLPEPMVDGSTATYPDVIEGGDLVVTATPTGFTHSIVLRERPTDPVEFAIPITTDGGELVEGEHGDLRVTAADDGGAVLRAPPPVMWDSSGSVEGDSAEGELGGDSEPVSVEIGETPSGTAELTLIPDPGFLADPDTVYPVTVDPSFSFETTNDTWISNTTTTSQQSAADLRVGLDGTTKYRSFLRFNGLLGSIPSDADIIGASLVMRNFQSLTCNSKAIGVARITEDWLASNLTWSNQPTASNWSAVYSQSMGFDASCPAGDAEWGIKPIVDAWRDGETPFGLRIKAEDETVANSYRRYRSLDYGGATSLIPHVSVNYNRAPGIPLAGAYPTTVVDESTYLSTVTPLLLGSAIDPDNDQTMLRFEVWSSKNTSTGTPLSSCDTEFTTIPNTVVGCTPTAALPLNSTVYLRAKAKDGANWAGGSAGAAAGWSAWQTLKTPAQPVLQGTWSIDPCTACTSSLPGVESLTPTLSATATDNDTLSLRYTFTIRSKATPPVTVATGTVDQTRGVAARWTVPAGVLAKATQYDVQVKVSDQVTPAPEPPAWSSFRVADSTRPSAPEPWTVTPCVAPCTGEVISVPSNNPTLRTKATDGDGDPLVYTYTVRDIDTEEIVTTEAAAAGTNKTASTRKDRSHPGSCPRACWRPDRATRHRSA
jgi:hypothetical protein